MVLTRCTWNWKRISMLREVWWFKFLQKSLHWNKTLGRNGNKNPWHNSKAHLKSTNQSKHNKNENKQRQSHIAQKLLTLFRWKRIAFYTYISCCGFLFGKPHEGDEYSIHDIKRHWNRIISNVRLNCNDSFQRPFSYSVFLVKIKQQTQHLADNKR